MRRIVLVFLQYVAMVTAICDLELDNTPIVLGEPFERITEEENNQLRDICGQRDYNGSTTPDNEGPTQLHEFPWTVAILFEFKDVSTVRCSGTLISKRHVVTASSCILRREDHSFVKEKDEHGAEGGGFYVGLGGTCHSEGEECESGIFQHFLSARAIGISTKFFADISYKYGHGDFAILELAENVEFEYDDEPRRVLPACLPSQNTILNENSFLYSNGFEDDGLNRSIQHYQRQVLTSGLPTTRDGGRLGVDCLNTRAVGETSDEIPRAEIGSSVMLKKDDRWSVMGALSGGDSVRCHTDLRCYLKAICYMTGVCYHTEK